MQSTTNSTQQTVAIAVVQVYSTVNDSVYKWKSSAVILLFHICLGPSSVACEPNKTINSQMRIAWNRLKYWPLFPLSDSSSDKSHHRIWHDCAANEFGFSVRDQHWIAFPVGVNQRYACMTSKTEIRLHLELSFTRIAKERKKRIQLAADNQSATLRQQTRNKTRRRANVIDYDVAAIDIDGERESDCDDSWRLWFFFLFYQLKITTKWRGTLMNACTNESTNKRTIDVNDVNHLFILGTFDFIASISTFFFSQSHVKLTRQTHLKLTTEQFHWTTKLLQSNHSTSFHLHNFPDVFRNVQNWFSSFC